MSEDKCGQFTKDDALQSSIMNAIDNFYFSLQKAHSPIICTPDRVKPLHMQPLATCRTSKSWQNFKYLIYYWTSEILFQVFVVYHHGYYQG